MNVTKEALEKTVNALGVILLDEKIRNFLAINDPKALQQVRNALISAGAEHLLDKEIINVDAY